MTEYRGRCILGLTHDHPRVICCAWFIFELHVIFTALHEDKELQKDLGVAAQIIPLQFCISRNHLMFKLLFF